MASIDASASLVASDAPDSNTLTQRIATLEERSRHVATQAQLYKVALMTISGIVIPLGGLVIHLHNQQIALIEKLLAG